MRPAVPRLVILGTGLGAFKLLTSLRDNEHITGVSPRKDFLFTPQLPSTTAGTIELRSVIEPVRHAHKKLAFYHAWAHARDADGILAVGGCRISEGPPLPTTAQTAQQEGTRLARILTARARHRPLEPFRHHYLGMSPASRGSVRLQSWRPVRAAGCRHGDARARPL